MLHTYIVYMHVLHTYIVYKHMLPTYIIIFNYAGIQMTILILQSLFLTLLILKEIKTISLALKRSVVLGTVPNEGWLRVTMSRGSHAQMSQTEANISNHSTSRIDSSWKTLACY